MVNIFILGSLFYFGGAALYVSARKSDREAARILKSVTRVNQLRDLTQLLDAERLPLVVTISGQVVSENPINCEITGLKGVIVEESVEKLYLKRKVICHCGTNQNCKCEIYQPQNTCNQFWTLHSKFISCNAEEVPWYLDDGTDRVHVAGARGATDFVYPAARTKEKLKQCAAYFVMKSYFQVEGLKRIEWAIPFGTFMTVVGEASKDDDGTIRIQQPAKGPFYVFDKTIDARIADFANVARWRKCASVSLTVFGAWLMTNR